MSRIILQKKTCIVCGKSYGANDRPMSLAARPRVPSTQEEVTCGEMVEYLFRDIKITHGTLTNWKPPVLGCGNEKRSMCAGCILPLKSAFYGIKAILSRMLPEAYLNKFIVKGTSSPSHIPPPRVAVKDQLVQTEEDSAQAQLDALLKLNEAQDKKKVVETPIRQKIRNAMKKKKESVTVRNEIRKMVHDEMQEFCKKSSLKNSNFRFNGSIPSDTVLEKEMNQYCPTVMKVFEGLFLKHLYLQTQPKNVNGQMVTTTWTAPMTVALGLASFARSIHCSAFQKFIGLEIYRSKATMKKVIKSFNEMGLSVSYDAVLSTLDELRKQPENDVSETEPSSNELGTASANEIKETSSSEIIESESSPTEISETSPNEVKITPPTEISGTSPNEVKITSPTKISETSPNEIEITLPTEISETSPNGNEKTASNEITKMSTKEMGKTSSHQITNPSPNKIRKISPNLTQKTSPNKSTANPFLKKLKNISSPKEINKMAPPSKLRKISANTISKTLKYNIKKISENEIGDNFQNKMLNISLNEMRRTSTNQMREVCSSVIKKNSMNKKIRHPTSTDTSDINPPPNKIRKISPSEIEKTSVNEISKISPEIKSEDGNISPNKMEKLSPNETSNSPSNKTRKISPNEIKKNSLNKVRKISLPAIKSESGNISPNKVNKLFLNTKKKHSK